MDLKELYETNERFRGYVDRHAKHYGISTEEALSRVAVREYAKEGEAKFIEPDTARMLGVQDIFYPNFPNCTMAGYEDRICIAEACKHAVPTYKDCSYYQQALKQMGE